MPLWKCLYLETLKDYVQNRYNITLSLTVKIKLTCFFWPSPLNSNFILLSDFPFKRSFQCPVYLSCIIIQSTSIALAYHYYSNFENSSKYHFLDFLILSPLAPHYNSPPCLQAGLYHPGCQSLTFWESERVLTTNLEISTHTEDIYI